VNPELRTQNAERTPNSEDSEENPLSPPSHEGTKRTFSPRRPKDTKRRNWKRPAWCLLFLGGKKGFFVTWWLGGESERDSTGPTQNSHRVTG
jgi:hypothetical protein